jgi:hypothetical protein
MSKHTPSRSNIWSNFNVGDLTTGSYVSLTGSTKMGDTADDTHQFTGSVYISGDISIGGGISGSLGAIDGTIDNSIARWDGTDGENITSSYVLIDDTGYITIPSGSKSGQLSTDFHQVSGSLNISGSVKVSGSSELIIGELPTGVSNDWGIYIPSASAGPNTFNTLGLWSSRVNQSGAVSIDFVADINSSSIDQDHKIGRFGYINDSRAYVESWAIKNNSIESFSASAAQVIGTDTDGALSIGTIVGSSASYSTNGAKLFQVLNNTTERESTDYLGRKTFCVSDAGGATHERYLTEILTVNSASFIDSVNEIPIGAMNYAVNVYVLSTIPDVMWNIGIPGSTEKWGAISSSVGSNNSTSSMKAGYEYYASASSIRLTPNPNASDLTTGSVRLEIRFREVTGPTS